MRKYAVWEASKKLVKVANDQCVDVFDPTGQWTPARIVDILNIGTPIVRVHYLNATHDLDENINLGSDRLAPLGFYTGRAN
jgi:hypothetical protein